MDPLEWLGPDTSATVLSLLDDPADLVRVAAVSRSYERFVISNGFSKKLCVRMCAEVSYFVNVIEEYTTSDSEEAESSTDMEWESLTKEHRAYSYLSYCLVSPEGNGDLIGTALRASSTDNYPDERIGHTLVESEEDEDGVPSYWSSKGHSDREVPETLTYRLGFKLCVINEIKIQPFRATFQNGNPIYSAKYVRFRMGHSMSPQANYCNGVQGTIDENYVWTYVSPLFQMVQENVLQSFRLPRPVICIGGIVQMELMGRVQVQETDGLYYICVCHVKVIGRPITPKFDVDILEDGKHAILKFRPEIHDCTSCFRRRGSSVQ